MAQHVFRSSWPLNYEAIANKLTADREQRNLLRLFCESPPIDAAAPNHQGNENFAPGGARTESPHIRAAMRLGQQVDDMLRKHAARPPIVNPKLSLAAPVHGLLQTMNIADPNGRRPHCRSIHDDPADSVSVRTCPYRTLFALVVSNLLFVCLLGAQDGIRCVHTSAAEWLAEFCRRLRAAYDRHSMLGIMLRSPAVLGLVLVCAVLWSLDRLFSALVHVFAPDGVVV